MLAFQCARGAPLRNEESIVLRVLDGMKQIMDSGDSGCLRMWSKNLILLSEVLSEGGTKKGMTWNYRVS